MRKNKQWSDLQKIYVFAVANVLLILLVCGGEMLYDTESYLEAWDSLCNGRIDLWRTPVYPAILGAIKTLVGESNLVLSVVVLQFIVFLISIRYLYKSVLLLSDSKKTAKWIVLFFIFFQWIAPYSNTLQTESFSISGIIFLIYFLIQSYKKNASKYIVPLMITSAFLLFLRPSFIYLLPVLFVSWLILIFKDRKKIALSLFGILSVVLLTLGVHLYMNSFKKTYGLYKISAVGTANQYILARNSNYLVASEDSALNAFVEESKALRKSPKPLYDVDVNILYFFEAVDAIDSFGIEKVDHLVNKSMKQNKSSVLNAVVYRLFHSARYTFGLVLTLDSFHAKFKGIYNAFICIAECLCLRVHLSLLYLILFIYTIALCIALFKKKRMPWLSSVLYMLGVSNIIVTILGAQSDFGRLILPSLPIYLLMFAQIISLFDWNIKRTNRELE